MMRLSLLAVLTWFAVYGDVVEQGPKNSAPSGLLAGVARADITPPIGMAQLNWGSQTHVEAVGVDPAGMYVTAIVLLCAGISRFGARCVCGGPLARTYASDSRSGYIGALQSPCLVETN